MSGDDEAELLRIEDDEHDDAMTRVEDPGEGGNRSIVAITITPSGTMYPTTSSSYYAVRPAHIFGAEVAGGTGTVTPYGAKMLAYNLGTLLPANGTTIVIHYIENRWVFRHG